MQSEILQLYILQFDPNEDTKIEIVRPTRKWINILNYMNLQIDKKYNSVYLHINSCV